MSEWLMVLVGLVVVVMVMVVLWLLCCIGCGFFFGGVLVMGIVGVLLYLLVGIL